MHPFITVWGSFDLRILNFILVPNNVEIYVDLGMLDSLLFCDPSRQL